MENNSSSVLSCQNLNADSVKKAFTVEKMVAYAEQVKGSKAVKTGSEYRIGRSGGLAIKIQDPPVWFDHSENMGGDCFDLVWMLEGNSGGIPASRFTEYVKKAAEIIGGSFETTPQTARTSTAFKAPKEPKQSKPLPEEWQQKFKAGLHSGEFSDICRLRGIKDLPLDDLQNVGFWPSGSDATIETGIKISPRSLVVWMPDSYKWIPLDGNGKRFRDKKANHSIMQTKGTPKEWPIFQPIDPEQPLYITEGEWSALALISIGLQAIPLKVEGDNIQDRFADLPKQIYLAYDNDKTGSEQTEKALKLRPDAIDIHRLWCGARWNEGADPNDFVAAYGNKYARIFIDQTTEILTEQAIQQQPKTPIEQPEQPKKAKTPTEKARMMTEGWMYDDYYEQFRDPDGKRWTFDEAIALFSRRDILIRPNTAAAELNSMVRANPARHMDGLQDRIRQLAAEYTEADAGNIDRYCQRVGFDAYETRRFHLWLYQICGRAERRGEKTDCMLVLAGQSQNTAKTFLFSGLANAIMGDEIAYYSFGSKDSDLLLAQKPLVLIDELDQVFKKVDVAVMKSKITQTGSYIRAPYDRSAKDRKNCAVFCATTNEENPIPTGENEARRYWVITPKKPLNFLSDAEPVGLMREAAYLTLKELSDHKGEIQKCLKTGKLWVQTPEEEAETVARNQSKKAEDSHSIAITTGISYMDPYINRERKQGKLYSASRWAVAFETGDGSSVGLDVYWKPPKASASAITRLITARCKRTVTREKGVSVAGYSFEQIKKAFCFDEQPEQPEKIENQPEDVNQIADQILANKQLETVESATHNNLFNPFIDMQATIPKPYGMTDTEWDQIKHKYTYLEGGE